MWRFRLRGILFSRMRGERRGTCFSWCRTIELELTRRLVVAAFEMETFGVEILM